VPSISGLLGLVNTASQFIMTLKKCLLHFQDFCDTAVEHDYY